MENNKIDLKKFIEEIDKNPYLAQTQKTTANSVFSFGRDHGHFGRILNQTVFCIPSLHVSTDRHMLTGFCFTPQDGNSLLSSISAALWMLDPSDYQDRMEKIKPLLFNEV